MTLQGNIVHEFLFLERLRETFLKKSARLHATYVKVEYSVNIERLKLATAC